MQKFEGFSQLCFLSMSSNFPQPSAIMSVTDKNISDLVAPLAFLSIEEENVGVEILKQHADVEPLPVERLLDGDIYIPVATVTKKRPRTFWGF